MKKGSLILSRKPSESIVVGDVVFHIHHVNGARVKVRIEAPLDQKVLRGELVNQPIKTEQAECEPVLMKAA